MILITLLKTALQSLMLEAIRTLSTIGLSLLSKLHSFLTTTVLLLAGLAYHYVEENMS
mgnify:CR=1 FL=1